MLSTKRDFLAAAAGLSLGAVPGLSARAQGAKPYRIMMNAYPTSAQGWLHLAQDRGYLKDAGVDLAITPGSGAWPAAPRMYADGYDFGYGDINSMVEVVARNSGDTPVAVFMMFNSTPSSIAVRADGPIKTPGDLKGKTLMGHDTDVGLRTLGALYEKAGVDPASVKLTTLEGSVTAPIKAMLSGSGPDGVVAYVSSIGAALTADGVDPDKNIRYLKFADYVPEFYGTCLMASRRMIRDHPDIVRAMVKATNRGARDLAADRAAVMAATMRRVPATMRAAEEVRLKVTLGLEMANREGKRLGIGDVDDARLSKSIALVARTNRLPRAPALSEIFDRQFMPPLSERVTSLAV